jgi:hypothetical protein
MRQTGSARGTRSKKSGQSPFFIGYKKHTVSAVWRIGETWRLVPLWSLVLPGGVADGRALKPLLNAIVRQLEWPVHFIVLDRGYVAKQRERFLRRRWGAAAIVAPKKNMTPPAGSDADGCPLCPAGWRLIWDDYDPGDEALIYRGDPARCRVCGLGATCPRQFDIEAGQNEIFWGLVPSHSRLSRTLLRRLRPLIEPGFNRTKNLHGVERFFLNSRPLAQMLCTLSDALAVLDLIAGQRPQMGREVKKVKEQNVGQLRLWD